MEGTDVVVLPFFVSLTFQDFSASMVFESKAPPVAVAVCGKGSLLTHWTVSPAATFSVSGVNAVPSMATVCVRAGARACGRRAPHPASKQDQDNGATDRQPGRHAHR